MIPRPIPNAENVTAALPPGEDVLAAVALQAEVPGDRRAASAGGTRRGRRSRRRSSAPPGPTGLSSTGVVLPGWTVGDGSGVSRNDPSPCAFGVETLTSIVGGIRLGSLLEVLELVRLGEQERDQRLGDAERRDRELAGDRLAPADLDLRGDRLALGEARVGDEARAALLRVGLERAAVGAARRAGDRDRADRPRRRSEDADLRRRARRRACPPPARSSAAGGGGGGAGAAPRARPRARARRGRASESSSEKPYRILLSRDTILNMVSSGQPSGADRLRGSRGRGAAASGAPTQARGVEKRDRIYEARSRATRPTGSRRPRSRT